MSRLLLAVALVGLAGCTSSRTAEPPTTVGDPVSDLLVGRWDMTRVYERGQDVTDQHDPADDRFIELYADGTFESGGQPYGRNTGRWTYDHARRDLVLDSDLGPEDDSQWVVTLRGDEMEWGGAGSEFARRFRITSRRVSR
ncbi:hypothetical protein [Rubrivirga sp.]|uniref:hypothetical protein n=1 Tax=Rubrivirga sp. TaxID=1885344 RepID=UPI003C75BE9C